MTYSHLAGTPVKSNQVWGYLAQYPRRMGTLLFKVASLHDHFSFVLKRRNVI